MPKQATLTEMAAACAVQAALDDFAEVTDFPVIRSGNVCVGFTTRTRLEAALKGAMDEKERLSIANNRGLTLRTPSQDVDDDDAEEIIGRSKSADFGRQSSIEGKPLPVAWMAEPGPFVILEDMLASRFYPLFTKAGVRAAAVVTQGGQYRGMISRAGLIQATREEEANHTAENGRVKVSLVGVGA